VDMAEEFAKMIITQRGFQANTKIISTSDSLLNTVISAKR
jgi:flagellar hook protein FlgE